VADAFCSLAAAFADAERNSHQTIYVYRVTPSGAIVRPYLVKTTGFFDDDGQFLSFLRDEHFGGDFRVLIRDGSRMVFSGDVSVWSPTRGQFGFK
jgi:hypothetical protein